MYLFKNLCCKQQTNFQLQDNKNKKKYLVIVNIQSKNPQNICKKFNEINKNMQAVQQGKQISILADNLQKQAQKAMHLSSISIGQFKSNQGQAGSQLNHTALDSFEMFNSSYQQLYKSQRSLETFKNLDFLQFIHKQIVLWSVKNVISFLGQIGLKSYQTVFYQNKIKGKDLITLKEDELRQDLMMKKSDIKILQTQIKNLQQYYHQQVNKFLNMKNSIACRTQKKKYKSSFSTSTQPSSCRKILTLIQNPIIEQSEEDIEDSNRNKQIFTDKIQTTNDKSGLLSH